MSSREDLVRALKAAREGDHASLYALYQALKRAGYNKPPEGRIVLDDAELAPILQHLRLVVRPTQRGTVLHLCPLSRAGTRPRISLCNGVHSFPHWYWYQWVVQLSEQRDWPANPKKPRYDLCRVCERKLLRWLNETYEDMLDGRKFVRP